MGIGGNSMSIRCERAEGKWGVSTLRKGGYSEIWMCGIRIVQVTIVV